MLWSKNLDPQYRTGNLPIALQSPLIHKGIVYLGSNQGKFLAMELENGRLVWESVEKTEYHGKPVIYKDQVIYGTVEGRVYSRNALTGELKFSVDLSSSVESEGVVKDGRIYFHLRNHQIFSLDVETGKIIWAYKRSVPFLTTLQKAATPVVDKQKVLVGFPDGHLVALSVLEGVPLFEVKLTNGLKFIDIDHRVIVHRGKIFANVVGAPIHILNEHNGELVKRTSFNASITPVPLPDEKGYVVPMVDGSVVVTDKDLNKISELKISDFSITNLLLKTLPGNSLPNIFITTSGGEFLEFSLIEFKNKSLENVRPQILRKKHLGHSYSAIFGDVDLEDQFLAMLSSRNRLYIFDLY